MRKNIEQKPLLSNDSLQCLKKWSWPSQRTFCKQKMQETPSSPATRVRVLISLISSEGGGSSTYHELCDRKAALFHKLDTIPAIVSTTVSPVTNVGMNMHASAHARMQQHKSMLFDAKLFPLNSVIYAGHLAEWPSVMSMTPYCTGVIFCHRNLVGMWIACLNIF